MKTTYLLAAGLLASVAARADFSYTQTTKTTKGPQQVVKVYFKGSKTASEQGNTVSIVDFAAQTITVIDKASKSYGVKKFSEVIPTHAGTVDPKMDVKETGATLTINGLPCTEMLLTTTFDAPSPAPPGTRMRVEVDQWISTSVPGWQNLRTFFQANSTSVAAIASGSSGLPKIMAELQKRLASTNGIPVRQSTRVLPLRQDPMSKGPVPYESLTENSNFSATAVSDSVFAIPTGFTKR